MEKEKGHRSVGAIIQNEKGEILMLERVHEPFGWAGPAGHIDAGESPEQAMIREVKEEVNLNVKKCQLLIHEYVPWNNCRSGEGHDWFLFKVGSWDGELKRAEDEAHAVKWLSKKELSQYNLEEVWRYWFKKLGLLKNSNS